MRTSLNSCGVVAAVIATACTPPVDRAAESAQLMETDRAFAAATAARGVDGWVSYFAEDGVMFRSGGLVTGADEIRDFMGPVFADSAFALQWEPTRADVSAAGDLGYTIGRYESQSRAVDGGVTSRTGSYVTVWRRQPDGAWKVVVDVGEPDDLSSESGQ